jgi:hypothetical protein
MAPNHNNPAPERWRADAGERDVAVLTIPPDAKRDRRFEVFCRFVVARRADTGDEAFHGLRVDVNGALEWQRRVPTENPGATDSLDYRFRREVPAGQALRIVAKTEVRHARRVDLGIEAEEG